MAVVYRDQIHSSSGSSVVSSDAFFSYSETKRRVTISVSDNIINGSLGFGVLDKNYITKATREDIIPITTSSAVQENSSKNTLAVQELIDLYGTSNDWGNPVEVSVVCSGTGRELFCFDINLQKLAVKDSGYTWTFTGNVFGTPISMSVEKKLIDKGPNKVYRKWTDLTLLAWYFILRVAGFKVECRTSDWALGRSTLGYAVKEWCGPQNISR